MPGNSGHPFGKYLLLDRIAAGGMAEIFRAKYVAAAGVTKSVVIKRILPHYAGNPAFVSMFTNEAKIAMSLAHGNIAQVFDFGEIDGEYFLAMEHVNGQSLSRLARGARDLGFWVPQPIAAHIVAEVCAGLNYAHSLRDEKGRPLGIVHRDVSPQNVIVSYEGQVKLVDFGIAKIRSAGDKETEHGAMKGKYVYFSPEQARGKPLDGRSDIYAAGIVLYELVVGRRPFEGKMMDVLSKITRGEFLPPSQLNPDVPHELEEIILKAMAPRVEDRYASAVELQDALRRYLHEADPVFSAASVSHLARFVGREDLEREGVRVEVPAEFVQKMESWRAPPRSTGEVAARSSSSSAQVPAPAHPDDRVVTEAEPEERTDSVRRPNRLLAAAGVLVLGLVAGLGVSFGLLRKVYTLEIVSAPPGAAVTLDGRQMRLATPARIDVASDRAHEVLLTMLGHRDLRRTVPPQKGKRFLLEAVLEPDPGAPPGEGVDDYRDPLEARGPVPVAAWPEVRQLALDLQAHAFPVQASAAARMRLDPGRTYRLALEGRAQVGSRPLRTVFYFAERVAGAAGEGSFGLLTPEDGATVANARALYAFVLRRPGETASGTLGVRVSEARTKKFAVLDVDPATHAVVPDDRLPRFIGLDPSAVYTLTVAGRADLGASGHAARVLFCLDGDTAEPEGLALAGAPKTLRKARGMWLLVPDDDGADNVGQLTVSLAPSH